MTPLLLLAEKVEGLEGPDREVDCLIYAAVHIPADRAGKIDISAPYVGWHPVDGPYVSAIEAPRYTASLDSAMTLVPIDGPGHFVEIQKAFRRSNDHSWARVQTVSERHWSSGDEGRGSTPALALVAAALRARAAMEVGE